MTEDSREIAESLYKRNLISTEILAAAYDEQLDTRNWIKNLTTAELVEELKTRDGVSSDFLEPKDKVRMITDYDFNGEIYSYEEEHTGPLTILYVTD